MCHQHWPSSLCWSLSSGEVVSVHKHTCKHLLMHTLQPSLLPHASLLFVICLSCSFPLVPVTSAVWPSVPPFLESHSSSCLCTSTSQMSVLCSWTVSAYLILQPQGTCGWGGGAKGVVVGGVKGVAVGGAKAEAVSRAMSEVVSSFHLLPYCSVPLPSPFPAQLNRYSGEMCFQLPHVFWLVVALLLTFTVIFPIPIFVLVINLKQFRVRMAIHNTGVQSIQLYAFCMHTNLTCDSVHHLGFAESLDHLHSIRISIHKYNLCMYVWSSLFISLRKWSTSVMHCPMEWGVVEGSTLLGTSSVGSTLCSLLCGCLWSFCQTDWWVYSTVYSCACVEFSSVLKFL